MSTRFATSPDHTHIAYEVNGKGPALMLLHGGGGSRQDWHSDGYVERLKHEFTVISVDLRGHGESDKPTDPACYTTEKMTRDFLTVADVCGIKRFMVWGYSFGGNVGRYLAARSDRVSKMVMIGNRLGSGVSGEFRKFALDFRARWAPVMQTTRGGAFAPQLLSPKDQEEIQQLSFSGELLPAVLAWSSAMLDWGVITPADLRCPTLWLIGSENRGAMDSYREYKGSLPESKVQVHVLEGLTHEQEVAGIDQVLPVMLAFTRCGLQTFSGSWS